LATVLASLRAFYVTGSCRFNRLVVLSRSHDASCASASIGDQAEVHLARLSASVAGLVISTDECSGDAGTRERSYCRRMFADQSSK
jgi:hypothetical protein